MFRRSRRSFRSKSRSRFSRSRRRSYRSSRRRGSTLSTLRKKIGYRM